MQNRQLGLTQDTCAAEIDISIRCGRWIEKWHYNYEYVIEGLARTNLPLFEIQN